MWTIKINDDKAQTSRFSVCTYDNKEAAMKHAAQIVKLYKMMNDSANIKSVIINIIPEITLINFMKISVIKIA